MKKYFVKHSQHTIEPEEILLDPLASGGTSTHQRLELPVPSKWNRIFLTLLFLMLGVTGSIVLYYQTIRNSEFYTQSDDNRIRLLFEDAPRGIIRDRFGKTLAENRMTFDVLVLALDLPRDPGALNHTAATIAQYVGLEPQSIFETLKLVQQQNFAQPQSILKNITKDAALALKSKEREMAGIRIQGRYVRYYPDGEAFAHVIGYTGRARAEEIKTDSTLRINDVIGRQGLEARWDQDLRGKRGETRYEVDAKLQELKQKETIDPQIGKNLQLSIDGEFQKYFYDVMRAHIAADGLRKGAAITLNPKTGEILSLISLPSFDNNLFVKGITQATFENLLQSKSKPLFNRAVGGEYSPGSVIKPFIGSAALEEGVVQPNTVITDYKGEIDVPNPYDPTKPTIFHDWKIHGVMTIRDALAQSSNVFFYTLGGGNGPIKGLGIERIKKYLSHFGFGTTLGVDLPGESSGLIPDPTWKQGRKSDPIWRIGDTYLTSIGQGDLAVTPLQLVAATAALANGGILYEPYTVKQVLTDNKVEKEFSPKPLAQGFIDPKWLTVVQEGMRQAVLNGTASALGDLPLKIAGKTGTAQILSNTQTNAFFIAYAPIDDPQIAMVIVVEQGRGGMTNAVPIARDIFQWWTANRYHK